MRYGLLVAGCFIASTVATEAKPWQQMTPQEGASARSLVQPYVLSAFDCIAGAIPGNPKALRAARAKDWLGAAAATAGACERTVAQMVRAIDVVFEPGEGARYVQNQFRSELPTSLSQRVRIPAQQTVTAPPAAKSEAEAAKKKLLEGALDKHLACVRRETIALVPYSSEGAETLATVIVGKCNALESEVIDIAVAAYGLSREEALKTVAGGTKDIRSKVVEQIVTARADAVKASGSRPQEQQGFQTPADGTRNVGKAY